MSISRQTFLTLGLVSAFSVVAYIATSQLVYRFGFPLDDAWIHQTYARNLGLYGEWAFIPGEPSGGSTSPLWSTLLAFGHYLRLGPYIWTFILGWLALLGTSLIGMACFQVLCPHHNQKSIWIGIFLSMEWHLVWFSVSGMESLLFALFVTWISFLLLIIEDQLKDGILIGILIGISLWLRPDGISLLGPAFLVVFTKPITKKKKTKIIGGIIASFLFFFILYLIFNRVTAGAWWPNTYFAKQAEYEVYRDNPILGRFWEQFIQPLKGPGILLLPANVLLLFNAFKRRKWTLLSLYLWLLGYLGLYAWRLPVAYQHGRYVSPMMPLFFVLGFVGLGKWVWKEKLCKRDWVLKTSFILILILVTVGSWVIGAKTYGNDVYYIESEMVETAYWLNQNTPESAIIAVHDIGAIGYFGNRKLLDLAGLISPDIIPFIRDEGKIKEHLDSQEVMYLVTFPDWYPELVKERVQVFKTTSPIRPSIGLKNMAVYKWKD